jgi:hypothetical protein
MQLVASDAFLDDAVSISADAGMEKPSLVFQSSEKKPLTRDSKFIVVFSITFQLTSQHCTKHPSLKSKPMSESGSLSLSLSPPYFIPDARSLFSRGVLQCFTRTFRNIRRCFPRLLLTLNFDVHQPEAHESQRCKTRTRNSSSFSLWCLYPAPRCVYTSAIKGLHGRTTLPTKTTGIRIRDC